MAKKILIISLTFMMFLLSSCSKNKNVWDYLDGNKEFVVGSNISNLELDNYNPNTHITIVEKQLVTDVDNTNYINLNDLSTVPGGIEVLTNKIKITKGGTYLFSGSYIGNIVVEDCNASDIRVILNGVNIESPVDSLDAPIKFRETSGMRILTIAAGTTNLVKDNSGNIGVTADEGVIVAKKSSLTINGTGRLIIDTVGSNSTGIKVKKELYLLGTNIEINALNNGIKANNKIIIKDSNITIKAGNDGIKTDMEPLTEVDALTYASSVEYGYLYIKNTSLNIKSVDDGLVANNAIYIDNTQNNEITIVSNNGKNDAATLFDGVAIKVSGLALLDSTTLLETKYPATHDLGYHIFINGGKFNLNSLDDAIKSNGYIILNGGQFEVNTSQTSINSNDLIYINNAKIVILNTLDGIKSNNINLMNSNISIKSSDDGIVADNKELINNDSYIYIKNTILKVIALGKGLDSNGYIKMDSGNVVINATTKDTACVNTETGLVINGGNFIAIGDYGMVENPCSNSKNSYLNASYTKIKEEGTIINIYDENGNIIYSTTTINSFYSVVISSSNFKVDETINIEIGKKSYDIEFEKHSILIDK